jgi:hypothetical protein
MDSGNRDELTAAVRSRRAWQYRVQGQLTVECQSESCPIGEIRITVKETSESKQLQPKISCPRCGVEMYYLRLE